MACYTVVTLDVTDPSWMGGYLPAVTAIVNEHGGRYLCRTPRIDLVEGDKAPQVAVVIEWPEKANAEAFYNDPRYSEHKAARLAGTDGTMLLIEGHDVIDD